MWKYYMYCYNLTNLFTCSQALEWFGCSYLFIFYQFQPKSCKRSSHPVSFTFTKPELRWPDGQMSTTPTNVNKRVTWNARGMWREGGLLRGDQKLGGRWDARLGSSYVTALHKVSCRRRWRWIWSKKKKEVKISPFITVTWTPPNIWMNEDCLKLDKWKLQSIHDSSTVD